MKRIALLTIFCPLFTFGQKINEDTLSFFYSDIVAVDSIPAQVLQSRARLFLTENFKSAKDVIQIDDKDGGIIVGKGSFIPVFKSTGLGSALTSRGFVKFYLKLQFKDGKFKYTFSDFVHVSDDGESTYGGSLANKKPQCGYFGLARPYWHQIKSYTDTNVIDLIDRLIRTMRSSELNGKSNSF